MTRRVDDRRACKRPIFVPTEEQVLELAEVARDDAMRTFTLVAAFSGLRLFEVAALERDDFNPAGNLHVRHGKGDRERVSLLYEPGLGALEAFLATSTRRRIWRTSHGNAFDRRFVSRLWGQMRGEVGFDGTFHALRHFHACWLLDKGASLVDVSIQLGHRDNGELVQRLYGRMRSVEAGLRRLDGLR